MKSLLFAGLLLFVGAHAKSPYFSSESAEIDSSEFGGPPGAKKTTCNCGWTNKPDKRVIGGVDSGKHQYPFIASLIRGGRQQFCGGTILTASHVLTAAHCTVNKKPSSMSVTLGDHDVTTQTETYFSQEIPVKDVIQHEDYDDVLVKNDIAILVLSFPIKFNERVGPACMPTGRMNIENQYVKLIGWGKLEHGAVRGSAILQKANLRIVPLEKCAERYGKYLVASDKQQICTYGDKKGSCQGDSGGPIVWLDPETNRYTLAGIVSFGRICGSLDPNVYTDVSAYVSWINKKISGSSQVCTKA